MLLQLNINNFALIKDLTIDFKEGFNILSGETGAGKSILIDAIDYVLGGKFSKDLIRTGEEKTYVEAIFTIENNNIKDCLDKEGIEYDDTLIISRETNINGKSIIKVNGKSLISSNVKRIREKLLDIHGQHQNQSLLQRSSHIVYLDNFIGKKMEEPLLRFEAKKEELLEIQRKINSLSVKKDGEKLVDYLKFQIEDINKGKLKVNEDVELKEEFNILNNSEKITKALSYSYNALTSGEDGIGVLDTISKIISELSHVENHHSDIKKRREEIENSFYSLQEISRDLRDISDGIVYDEFRLAKINERIYEIDNYKKKYGSSIEDILEHKLKLEQELIELTNREEILNELKEKEVGIFNELKDIGIEIHEIRKNNKGTLEERILAELSYVGLEKSRISINVELVENFNERGFDDVSILISTNPGEPLKNLEKVLSGGELSRIMLALKCVFASKDEIPTLIFDEIDTGISGSVGQRVGEKMYSVSVNHQVLCITHLPQIAILSDCHYFVSKNVENDKTYTKIKVLSRDEKIYQVATMLGGDIVTDATLENVKEMESLAEEKKKEIKMLCNT